MATRKLEKPEWQRYFDWVSTSTLGQRAEIEVASLEIGAQVEAEWLPILGLVYDPQDDLLEVVLEGVDHLVRKPREIYVDEGIAGLESLMVVDADGVRQILRLRDPLMLPAPSTAAP
ncbi:MAG: hypothetical protein JWO70_5367 [Betaproteobacteria bacterium]|nr:hypothetical protein [Betaproteobacteria bacterium]